MSSKSGEAKGRGDAFAQFYRWVFGIGHERNVGGAERAVRYVGGFVCLLAGIGVLAVPVLQNGVANGVLAVALVGTGLYLVYEAQVQYCPLNETLGRSTYRGRE